MDSRSRLNEGPAKAPKSFGTDREERLLRFVDILRTEQVRASIGANAEGGGTGFRRWRGLALFLTDTVEPTAPPAAIATRPDPIEPRALRHEADAAAAPPPARAEAEVSEPETAKPVLLVYYPHGSRHGEATARSLAAPIGSVVTSSDIKAPTSLPDDAMIVFSEERNHEFARMIGKSLGDSGYRWKIEKIPSPVGSHRNMIEVWLPMK
jgi:hypothetical protein